jgi:hypothetical protein
MPNRRAYRSGRALGWVNGSVIGVSAMVADPSGFSSLQLTVLRAELVDHGNARCTPAINSSGNPSASAPTTPSTRRSTAPYSRRSRNAAPCGR